MSVPVSAPTGPMSGDSQSGRGVVSAINPPALPSAAADSGTTATEMIWVTMFIGAGDG